MDIYILHSNLHVFQAVLIARKRKAECLFLIDKNLVSSPYIPFLSKGSISFIDSDALSKTFVRSLISFGSLKRVKDLCEELSINLDKVENLFLGQPAQYISSLFFNALKARKIFRHTYILDDGLSSIEKSNEYSGIHFIIGYIKHYIKHVLRIIMYIFSGFELLWAWRPNRFIIEHDKTSVYILPKLASEKSQNHLGLIDLIENKDLKSMIRDLALDNTKQYYFLSYFEDVNEEEMSPRYIYVGHPRRSYKAKLFIIKNVPSELIMLSNLNVHSQHSTLILIFVFGQIHLGNTAMLTVHNGENSYEWMFSAYPNARKIIKLNRA